MRYLFLLLLLFLQLLAEAGVLKGRITDERGEGMPFANISVKGTNINTASNENGFYQLPLEPGRYEIVFQFVGYKAHITAVEIGEKNLELNVVLEQEVVQLQETVVRATDKDPAYSIIRDAQQMRRIYRREVEAYSCQVYIKGLQRLTDVPNKVLGIRVGNLEPGVIYLSESVSELHFKQPDKYREKMLASKVSGKSKSFSYNQASEMDFTFYDNLLKAPVLTQRGFVSPIAANAMLFYRYKLEGSFYENGRLIYKIKVTPIRKNDPVFEGHIYIVDEEWRIHSVDLLLTKNANIEFVDELRIHQVYGPTPQGVWVLLSQKYTFKAEGFGFKGNGYYTAVYSKYKVQPAYRAPVQAAPEEPEEQPVAQARPKAKPKRREKPKPEKAAAGEIEPIHDKKFFNNEILSIEEGVNERDSAYWAQIRPVPLTVEEVKDYEVKDSLQTIRESKAYKDSVDNIRNRFSLSEAILRGYRYHNSPRYENIQFASIFRIWQYNTVEGLVVNIEPEYSRWFGQRRLELTPAVRYGFSNEKLNARVKAQFTYNRQKFAWVSAEGGRYVEQYNRYEPITPFINSVYTLLLERNYLKLYQKDYLKLGQQFEVANGLLVQATLEYARRRMLFNTTDFTFNDRPHREFSPNIPENEELENTAFPAHNAYTFTFVASWRPAQQYISRPNRKIPLESKYPRISFGYRKGLSFLPGSDVNYDHLALSVDDDMDLGLLGTSRYDVTAGTFLNKQRMFFMDYKHFPGNRTILAGNFEGFQLHDYYRYSTNNSYFEAHYAHHFNGFLFNKIPLFRRLKWQEVGSFNYLYTRASRNYAELGVGIEHIFKIVRVDFVTAFQSKEKVSSGIRIGLGF